MTAHLHELYYNLGHVLHQQGDLQGSADSYRQAIAHQPTYANAHHNLGVVLDEQGQRLAAICSYQRAIALNPTHIKAYSNLGCVLVKQGQFDAAIQVYHQAIALQPDWATLHNNLGQALLALGDGAGAIAAYRHALTLQPDMAQAHYNLGKAWQGQGQHAAAIESFQSTAQLQPDHEWVYSDWSVSLLAMGKVEQAMECWHQAIAPYSAFIAAYCRWAEGLTEQDVVTQSRVACGHLLRSLQRSTHHPELYGHLVQTYQFWGQALTVYGGIQQYRQAEALYQKALQIAPHHIELYRDLGLCLARQNRLDAAMLVYHLALTIEPAQPQIHLALGHILETQQQLDAAIACYHTVLQCQKEDGAAGIDRLTAGAIASPVNVPATLRPTSPPSSTRDWLHATGADPNHYIRVNLQPAETSLRSPSLTPSHPATQPCAGLNCLPCLQQIIKAFEPIQIAQHIYACTGTGAMPTFPTFVATIPQGRVWIAPQQNEWMVCHAIATLTADQTLLTDLSRHYPGQLPGCQSSDPTQHPIFSQNSLPSLHQVSGSVAVLAGLSGNTYFHWMVDILPRLEILRQSGLDLDALDWVLVNSDRHPFQQETLDILGVPAPKRLQSDRHPHLQASQLVVPSFPGHLGWLQPWALEFLRREFLPLATSRRLAQSPLPERIYISRAHARYRQVLNEADVVDFLSQRGFVAIAPESLAFADQVALFAHARVIIAPHGSGLTNTVFCHPGAIVVELVSPHYIRHYYWLISQHLQLKHYYITGEPLSCYPIRELMYPNPLIEDILVNLNAIHRLMTILNLTD